MGSDICKWPILWFANVFSITNVTLCRFSHVTELHHPIRMSLWPWMQLQNFLRGRGDIVQSQCRHDLEKTMWYYYLGLPHDSALGRGYIAQRKSAVCNFSSPPTDCISITVAETAVLKCSLHYPCNYVTSTAMMLMIMKHSVAAVLIGILDSGSYWIWYWINNQALCDRFNTCLL